MIKKAESSLLILKKEYDQRTCKKRLITNKDIINLFPVFKTLAKAKNNKI